MPIEQRADRSQTQFSKTRRRWNPPRGQHRRSCHGADDAGARVDARRDPPRTRSRSAGGRGLAAPLWSQSLITVSFTPSGNVVAPNALETYLGKEYGLARSMCAAASPPVVFYPTNRAGSKPVLHGGLCTANAARVYGIALGGCGSDPWSRMLRKKWATIAPTMKARTVPNHG